MNKDEQHLAAIPDHISIDLMLKATPSSEGGRRYIYFEASNEGVDQQGERVLAKALDASADYFLKFGNIDIDHYTLIGPKMGIKDAMSYEIGRPVDVKIDGDKTFVKAELYQGTGALAEQANMVWESMTAINPPARWYPSVGGAVLAKSIQIDPDTKERVAVIDRVRWSNVGLSRTPVNQHLPCAQSMPIGSFAKSLNGFVVKSLEAGYATDSSMMTGGEAMRLQSLDGAPYSYFDFRDQISRQLIEGRAPQSADGMIVHTMKEFRLPLETAEEWVSRFLGDIKTNFQ